MAKYVFSKGKVTVEAGVYVPCARRDRRLVRAGVLIVIPLQSLAGEQLGSTSAKENSNDSR